MDLDKKVVPLGIGIADDHSVHHCDHVAYFWETEREFKKAIGFIEIGLRAQDHCVIFGHDEANQKVLAVMRERGFDGKRLVREGRLSVLGAESTGDATLASIGSTFQKALDKGAPLIRLLGNIGWGRPDWPNEADILAFESRVTTAAKMFPCVVVCMYDVKALSGRIIMRGGLETHPVTIRGNVVRVNTHYVPVETFLEQLRTEKKSTPD